MSYVEFSLSTLAPYTLQTKATSTRFWDRCLQGKTFLVQTVVDQWGGSFTFDPGDLIFHWNLYFYLYFFDQLIYSLLSRQWPSWSSLSEGPWPVHRLNKDWFLLISNLIARVCCFKEQDDHLRLLLSCGLFALVLLPRTLNPGGWFLKPMKGFLLKRTRVALTLYCLKSEKSHYIELWSLYSS